MWTSLIMLVVGLALGFFLRHILGPTKKQVEQITCSSQQVYLSYLIDDELYRARLNKWMKSSQAYFFSQLIAEKVGGRLYLMPFDNEEEMKVLLKQLEKSE